MTSPAQMPKTRPAPTAPPLLQRTEAASVETVYSLEAATAFRLALQDDTNPYVAEAMARAARANFRSTGARLGQLQAPPTLARASTFNRVATQAQKTAYNTADQMEQLANIAHIAATMAVTGEQELQWREAVREGLAYAHQTASALLNAADIMMGIVEA